MVRLVSADSPDVVCLQEVPVWALLRLAEWSGMAALGDVAQQPSVGPVPATAGLGRARMLLLGHLHATFYRPDERLPDAELLRAAVFADGHAEPGDVRGGEPSPLEVWPAERRAVDGVLLSDHAPVEVEIR